jgi:hypothetical protein
MTAHDAGSARGARRPWPVQDDGRAHSSPWRRALAADLRLNVETFAGTVILSVLALLLALAATDVVSGIAPLWGVLAWYRYGRQDTAARNELWASLGLSRADRVHGRVALVALESVLMVVVSAAGTALTVVGGHTPSMIDGTPTGGDLVATTIAGIVTTSATMVLAAIVLGRECTTRRPGVSMFVLSILTYIGAAIVLSLIGMVVVLPLSLAAPAGAEAAAPWIAAALSAVVGVIGAFVLRRSMRRWIRELDSRDAGPSPAHTRTLVTGTGAPVA